jgi:TolB-like protein
VEFFERLKQRKVVQWALAYVAASFAFIQVADIVAQRFGWPPESVRFLIIGLAIGFFVTLVLAWYHGERGSQRISGTELSILALLLAIGGAVTWRLAPTVAENPQPTPVANAPQQQTPADRKSIAVLPFESLSKDEDNAYFASGMQDMILTKLAGIGDLKVISRTSTEKYKSHPDNLKVIAKELGVATVLEGSVQKSGDKVLINLQLIDADTDNHLWAEAYPRTLDNIFGVEGEVAQKVAEALHAALTHDERAALALKPTQNAEALQAYLKALAMEKSPENSLIAVGDELQKAVSLDPNFTLAWTELVWQKVRVYWFGLDATEVNLSAAKAALDRAVALSPDMPQVEMARSQYLYYAQRDFVGALALMQQVQRGLPNDARTWFFTALVERRRGLWDDALRHFHQAQTLDPHDEFMRYEILTTLMVIHEFKQAAALVDGDFDAAKNPGPWEMKLFAAWNLGGLEAGARLLSPVTTQAPSVVAMRATQAFFQRDFAAASTLFAQAVAGNRSAAGDDFQSEFFVGGYLPTSIGWQLHQATSKQRMGAASDAASLFAGVRQQAQTALAAKPVNLNIEAAWHAIAGLAEAGLGERDQAVAEGKRATELIP